MTTKYTSGMYDGYPGALIHHPNPYLSAGIEEQKPLPDDVPTTMRKLKEHVKNSFKNIKPIEYPEGKLMDSALEDTQAILDMVDTMQKVLLRYKRLSAQA